MFIMNASRLRSWPAYLWYSHGIGPPSNGGALLLHVPVDDQPMAVGIERRNQDDDDVLQDGEDARTRSVVASVWSSSFAAWVPPISEA